MAGLRAIDFSVDAAQFHELLGKMSKLAPKVRAELRKQIKLGALALVVPEAKARLAVRSPITSRHVKSRRFARASTKAAIQAGNEKRAQAAISHEQLLESHRDTGLLSGIADSIRVTMATSTNSGRVGAFVVSDGSKVPGKTNLKGAPSGDPDSRRALAIIFDQGQKGTAKGSLKFRHPVFGDRKNWQDQQRIPYLDVSVKTHQAALTTMIETAFYDAVASLNSPFEVI